MSLMSLIFCLAATHADNRIWLAQREVRVVIGSQSFKAAGETEQYNGLTYLRKISFKDARGVTAQTFATPEVNASEEEKFELSQIKLRSGQTDLILRAFDSAQAGTAYIYFVWDPVHRKIVRSLSTLPLLRAKGRTFRSAVQGVEFEFANNQYREKN